MAEKEDKLQRQLPKSGDQREQAVLDQVWEIRKKTSEEFKIAKEAVRVVRRERREINAKIRSHEAVVRFLILRYVIRQLKEGGRLVAI